MSIPSFLDRIGEWPAAVRYGLLTIIALAFFLPGFTTLPPIDRDESRFAQATKQMVQTGDYIDIRFQGKPRHKKPAGIYWMQAASAHLTGAADSIWTYRIPSLIGAVAAVLLTAAIGGLLFGPGIGFAAGVIMAASVLLNVEARTAKTDAMLLAATLAALACLIRVWQQRRNAIAASYGFWAALGIGFLIKGPLLFLPIAGFVVAASIRERSMTWLRRLRPLTGVLLFIAIAAPWYVAITVISDGGFFAESLGKDLAAKVAGGQESHGAPPGLYIALAPVTFWPFSLIGLLAIPWIWRSRKQSNVMVLLGWVLLTWIVFALTPTKLAHYILPAYPALAILAAAALYDNLPARIWWRWTAFVIWGLVTVALAFAMPVLGTEMDLPRDWGWLAGLLILIALYFNWRLAMGRMAVSRQLVMLTVCAGVFSAAVFGRFLPDLNPAFISPRLVAAVPERDGCSRPHLASAGFTEPSLVFLTETRTLLTPGAGAADHLLSDPVCGVAAIEHRQSKAFLDRVAANGQNVISTGTVTGFNYARGKQQVITLYVVEPDR